MTISALGHFVGGRAIAGTSGRTGPVFNPATGQQTGAVALASADELDHAVATARAAFEDWRFASIARRTEAMFNLRNLVKRNAAELAAKITAEHGKVHSDALGEVARGLENIEFACTIGEHLKGIHSNQVSTDVDVTTIRRPLGVVAGITPFNFPAMVPLWMIPNALACGNSFVLKPSEKDPSAALFLAELITEAGFPDGVFNVVNGDKTAVDAILRHPDIEAVSFVGSTPIAQYIHRTAGENGKRVQALGGAKNHMLVLPDADIGLAADAAVSAGFGSAGERCMAISVVVAVGEAADPLVAAIAERTRGLTIGDGMEPASEMGPLVTREHRDKVASYVGLGADAGATVVLDGREVEFEGDGFWLGCTLLDHVTPDMQVYRDEVFGPLLAVVRVDTFDDAIALLNDNPYGNGTAIFTRDGGAARRFTEEAPVGMVGVNVPIPVPVGYHSFGVGRTRSSATPTCTARKVSASTPRRRRSRPVGPTRPAPRSTSASRPTESAEFTRRTVVPTREGMLSAFPAVDDARPDRGASNRAPATTHRDDIQVLRAVAVVVVVLYHLNVPLFDAGFIGVDLFFVISGYLITRLLVLELMSTGRVALGRFTARRVRRLLPMSFVVLIATLILVRLRWTSLQQLDEIDIARAAATFRANFALADRGTDYLVADEVSSFQHYWSLAVEEQFYLLLPLSLVVVSWFSRGWRVVAGVAGFLVVVTAATFVIAVQVTDGSPPEAYFLLHTRAWEFTVGGLVACAELVGWRPGRARPWRIAGGVGLLVALAVSHQVAFPGPGAVPVVVAGSLLVWAGVGQPDHELSGSAWAPLRWIGDRSYSIYLWHWPPIAVFGLDDSGFGDRPMMRLGIIVATIVLAAGSYRLIEERFRSAELFRGVVRSTLLLVALTLVGYLAVGRLLSAGATLSGAEVDGVAFADLRAGVIEVPDAVPANLTPPLVDAARDVPPIYASGCHAPLDAVAPLPVAECSSGGSGATGTIVLVGDSHAAQWFDAVEAAAVGADARLVAVTKSACSLTGNPGPQFASACEAWRPAALDQIEQLQPDVLVVGNIARIAERDDPASWLATARAGLADLRRRAPEAEIVFVLDGPLGEEDMPNCLLQRGPDECVILPSNEFDRSQRELAADVDVVIDPVRYLCRDADCPAVIGNVLVYRDEGHLSRAIVRVLDPLFVDALETAGMG